MPPSKTKQLAKKLGLVKKGCDFIRSEGATKDGHSKKRRIQFFSYIIVLDFESTCWKNKKGLQEIIEFPCVLVDVVKGQIISEFQQYVQPQERPILSSFCTELTGIKQEQVDNGVPLPTCLMLFKKWIKKLEEDHSFVMAIPGQDFANKKENLCALATWTDWDLDVCLKYECQRKQIKKPSFFSLWIDLKATYKNFYERKPTGLRSALVDVGIEFQGREHCGLDDARNTAMLCIRLINDGCVLRITKSIQALEPITNVSMPKPNAVPSRPCQLPQEPSISHTSIPDNNDSFNIPTEAWLDVSIPEPSLVSYNPNETSKDSRISATKSTKENSPSVKDPSNNQLILTSSTSTPNPHIFNPSVSPFIRLNKATPFNIRRTSTPIVTNTHSGSSCSKVSVSNCSSSLFKTPNSNSGSLNQRTLSMTGSSLFGKVTPPICRCGKRTKRKIVNSEGPNEGKPFYCCCFGRQKGCGYFEWELSILKKFHEDCTPELLTSEYD